MADLRGKLAIIVREHESQILSEWIDLLAKGGRGVVDRTEVEAHARSFVRLLADAMQADGSGGIDGPEWAKLRAMLATLSASRARQGSSPTETATFIFSFKQPLFSRLQMEYRADAEGLARDVWTATLLLDRLGLLTTELFLKSREEVIMRQQREMLELSTPVVALWEGILAVPLIGTLDSERTQVVMDNLLERIVETGASIAIIDITGVPTVDTLVAQHLLKTVGAARLMGAECIISGIRPQIAQTIVHLGVDLGNVATKATLADALVLALGRVGATVTRITPVLDDKPPTERIPILKLGEFLLVTIQVEMHDRLVMTLQDELTQQIVRHRARGVLIDISALEIVDSFIGRALGNIANMSRILDAETVVVGMRPAVAITLVELGLNLDGVRTALNAEKGMDLIRRRLGRGGELDARGA